MFNRFCVNLYVIVLCSLFYFLILFEDIFNLFEVHVQYDNMSFPGEVKWSVKKNGLWNEVWGRGGGPGVSDGVIWGFLLQVASCWPYNLLQNEGCFEKTWATRTEVFKGNFSVDWFISFTWSTIEQASTEIAITCNLLKWMKVKMFWLHFKNTF